MKQLALLLVEDSEIDAALIVRLVEKAGYQLSHLRVETEGDLRDALREQKWDALICDYTLPLLDAPHALTILRETQPETPFIVVSGAQGEELAVTMMKAGAQDYVMKGSLSRLVPAVERELVEAEHRRERKRAEVALSISEERWKFALEGAGDGVWDWDLTSGDVVYSRRWKEMLGHAEDEIGSGFEEWDARLHPEDRAEAVARVNAYLEGKTSLYANELRMRCKDGSYKWILTRGMITSRDQDGKPLRIVGTHTDVTEHKQVLAARAAAEEALRQNAKELMERNEELLRFNRTAVDREIRMLELKQEINRLLERLGEERKYQSIPQPPSMGAEDPRRR